MSAGALLQRGGGGSRPRAARPDVTANPKAGLELYGNSLSSGIITAGSQESLPRPRDRPLPHTQSGKRSPRGCWPPLCTERLRASPPVTQQAGESRDSPSSALCCGVTASSLLASLAIERVMRPLRRPWLLAVLRPLEATASFSSLSSPDVSSVFSLRVRGHRGVVAPGGRGDGTCGRAAVGSAASFIKGRCEPAAVRRLPLRPRDGAACHSLTGAGLRAPCQAVSYARGSGSPRPGHSHPLPTEEARPTPMPRLPWALCRRAGVGARVTSTPCRLRQVSSGALRSPPLLPPPSGRPSLEAGETERPDVR